MHEGLRNQVEHMDTDYDSGTLIEKEARLNLLRDEITQLKGAESKTGHLQNVDPEKLSAQALSDYAVVRRICKDLGVNIIDNRPEDLKRELSTREDKSLQVKEALGEVVRRYPGKSDNISERDLYAMLRNSLWIIQMFLDKHSEEADSKISESRADFRESKNEGWSEVAMGLYAKVSKIYEKLNLPMHNYGEVQLIEALATLEDVSNIENEVKALYEEVESKQSAYLQARDQSKPYEMDFYLYGNVINKLEALRLAIWDLKNAK